LYHLLKNHTSKVLIFSSDILKNKVELNYIHDICSNSIRVAISIRARLFIVLFLQKISQPIVADRKLMHLIKRRIVKFNREWMKLYYSFYFIRVFMCTVRSFFYLFMLSPRFSEWLHFYCRAVDFCMCNALGNRKKLRYSRKLLYMFILLCVMLCRFVCMSSVKTLSEQFLLKQVCSDY